MFAYGDPRCCHCGCGHAAACAQPGQNGAAMALQVCAAIGLCDQTSGRTQSTSRKLQMQSVVKDDQSNLQDNPLCPFCTAAVGYVKAWAPHLTLDSLLLSLFS